MLFKRWTNEAPKGPFFRRSLVLVLLIACLPGIVTGVVLYGWLTGSMERMLQQADLKQLEHRAAFVTEQLDDLELSFSQWGFDPMFDSRLKHLDFVYEYKQVHELYRTLLIIQNSNALIDGVELYLQQPKPLTLTANRYDFLKDSGQISRYNQLVEQPKTIYWKHSSDGKSMMAVIQLSGENSLPFGVLTLTLDSEQLSNLLQTLNPYSNGSTVLMDSQGEWIIPPSSNDTGLNAALRSRVRAAGSMTSSFRMEYDGTVYSVKQGTFRRLGADWTYVSAVPLTDIAAPMLSASKIIVYVNAAGLLLALLLSWVGSLHLYEPVGRFLHTFKGERMTQRNGAKDEFGQIEQHWLGLKQEREALQNRLEQQLPVVRRSFVLQLVQGHLASMPDKDLRDRFARLGWPVQDEQFVAVFAQFSSYVTSFGKSEQENEDILIFAAADLLKNIVDDYPYKGEIINFHDLSIGLLLAVPKQSLTGVSSCRVALINIGQRWVEKVKEELGIRITVAVSEIVDEAVLIPHLFRITRYALRSSFLPYNQNVIDLGNRTYEGVTVSVHYPVVLEQELIAAIRSGDVETAMDMLRQFIEELTLAAGSEKRLKQALLQLLASIQHTMIQLGGDPFTLFAVDVFEELLQLNSSDDVLLWFRHRIIKVCIEEYTGKEEQQIKLAVHSMKEHADQCYAEAMSLEELADLHQIHSYTLSRAFKQIIGQNFVDYLTEVRLNCAKRLIKETDGKINEIAERVGYQASYFNRIFKKSEGITPSRYRDRLRIAEQEKRDNGSY